MNKKCEKRRKKKSDKNESRSAKTADENTGQKAGKNTVLQEYVLRTYIYTQ